MLRRRIGTPATPLLAGVLLVASCAIVDSIESGLGFVGRFAKGIARGTGEFDENGKQEGEWQYLSENGRLRAEGRYENDVQVGLWTYYFENGQKEYEGRLEGERRVGRYQYWHPNGFPRATGHFVLGREFGQWTFWDSSGRMSQRGPFANGLRHGRWASYHPDGTLASEGLYSNGEAVGRWRIVPRGAGADGEKTAWTPMPDGAEWIDDRWDDGAVRREGFLVNGRQHGLWTLNHRSGDPRLVGLFESGTPHGHFAVFGTGGEQVGGGHVEVGRPVGPWQVTRGGTVEVVDATAFPPSMPFVDEWSEVSLVRDRGVPGALAVWLSEARAPTSRDLVADHTEPAAEEPEASAEELAASTPEPDVPVVAQPFTKFEQDTFAALVKAYRKGGEAVKALRSRYARTRGRTGPPAELEIPEPGGDQEVAATYIGKPLPLDKFRDETGAIFDLDLLKGQKVVLVVLRGYPGAVCVYCTAQTAALCEEGAFETFEELGAKLQIVFPGEKNGLEAFKQAVGSLSDEELPPYGMLYENDYIVGPMLKIEGSKVIPSTFILDEEGIVRFAYIARTDADRPSCKLLEAELKKLDGGR